MPFDAELIKWFISSYGLPAALAVYVFWNSIGKSDTKRDVAQELITKIDSLSVSVQDVRERVSKMEGRLYD